MQPIEIKKFIMAWAFLIITIVLLSNAYAWMYPNNIIRNRLERIEAFQNIVLQDPKGDIASTVDLSPSDTTLNKPKEAYSLLNDMLKPHIGTLTSPTSKACYESDFQTRLERTGNFKQMTNNYKRGVPDSCSAPNHDLSLSFYKVDPIP